MTKMAQAMNEQGSVHVSVKSFAELFRGASYPVAIDTYQRSYVWGTEKVDQLIADLKEFCDNTNTSGASLEYYMGAVLLHEDREKQKLFIIDGQQRLTSLCLLHYALTGVLPDNQALRYHSSQSVTNIKQAQMCFEQSILRQHAANLFDRICFTVITVLSEDLAFNFFRHPKQSRGTFAGHRPVESISFAGDQWR